MFLLRKSITAVYKPILRHHKQIGIQKYRLKAAADIVTIVKLAVDHLKLTYRPTNYYTILVRPQVKFVILKIKNSGIL